VAVGLNQGPHNSLSPANVRLKLTLATYDWGYGRNGAQRCQTPCLVTVQRRLNQRIG
jgi:hypothetical protein